MKIEKVTKNSGHRNVHSSAVANARAVAEHVISQEEIIYRTRQCFLDNIQSEINEVEQLLLIKSSADLQITEVESQEVQRLLIEQLIEQLELTKDEATEMVESISGTGDLDILEGSEISEILLEKFKDLYALKVMRKRMRSESEYRLIKLFSDLESISLITTIHDEIIKMKSLLLNDEHNNELNHQFDQQEKKEIIIKHRLLWELYSGNCSNVPDNVRYLLRAPESLKGGESITIPFKPVFWRKITSERRGSGKKSKRRFSDDEKNKIHSIDEKEIHLLIDMKSVNKQREEQLKLNGFYWKNLSFIEFCISLPLFQHLSHEKLHILNNAVIFEVFHEDDCILDQYETINHVYLIRNGSVSVLEDQYHQGYNHLYKTIQILRGGDIFGFDRLEPPEDEDNFNNHGTNITNEVIEGVCSSLRFQAVGNTEVYMIPIDVFTNVFLHDMYYARSSSLQLDIYLLRNDCFKESECGSIHLSEYEEVHQETMVVYSQANLDIAASSKDKGEEKESVTANMKKADRELDAQNETAPKSVEVPPRRPELLLEMEALFDSAFHFEEVLDNFMYLTQQALAVDRASVFILDKASQTMVLYSRDMPEDTFHRTVSDADIGNAAVDIDHTKGASNDMESSLEPDALTTPAGKTALAAMSIRMPLKGIAAHVAQHVTTINLPNCLESPLFDPSMDLRTGYRTRQMLCTPVCDSTGNVVAVLQFINPLDGKPFNESDIRLAGGIARIMATKAISIHYKSSMNMYQSLHTMVPASVSPLQVSLLWALTPRPHRHLRCKVELLVGGVPLLPAQQTELFNTSDYDLSGDLRKVEMNARIVFKSLMLSDLPANCRIFFTLLSKNNHPAAWCGISLFDYHHALCSGDDMELLMWDDGIPDNSQHIPFADASLRALPYTSLPTERSSHATLKYSGSVIAVRFKRATDVTILHEFSKPLDYKIPSSYFTGPLVKAVIADAAIAKRGINDSSALEESMYRPLTTQLSKLSQAASQIFHAMEVDHDVVYFSRLTEEARQVAWNLRYALSQECPWALNWFLSSVNWLNAAHSEESYRLLYKWNNITAPIAIQLLDGDRFNDRKIRVFAVHCIERELREGSALQSLNILFLLISSLKFEPFVDSALARLLLREGLREPDTVGKQLLWYLQSVYYEDPVVWMHCHYLQKLYLRSLPDQIRARQCHGLYAIQRINTIYRGIIRSNLLPNPATAVKSRSRWGGSNSNSNAAKVAAAVRSNNKMTAELLMEELDKSPWPSEFTLPLPQQDTRQCTGVVKCVAELAQERPHHQWQQLHPEQLPHDLFFTVKYPDFTSRTIKFANGIDCSVEMMYHYMLQCIDFIWTMENVPLHARSYECLPVMGEAATGACLISGVPLQQSLVSIQTLIVKYIEAQSAATKAQPKNVLKKNKYAPDKLVTHYFHQLSRGAAISHSEDSITTGTGGERPHLQQNASTNQKSTLPGAVEYPAVGYNWDVESDMLADEGANRLKSNFTKSLAARFLLEYALDIKRSDCETVLLANDGSVHIVNPESILRIERMNTPETPRNSPVRDKKGGFQQQGIPFLPAFFADVMEADDYTNRLESFSDFIKKGFMSLRRHARFLIWSFIQISKHLHITNKAQYDAVELLKERLLLYMFDEAAAMQMKDLIVQAVNASPQLQKLKLPF